MTNNNLDTKDCDITRPKLSSKLVKQMELTQKLKKKFKKRKKEIQVIIFTKTQVFKLK